MPKYFAQFYQVGNNWVRHDTRIYLSDFGGTTPRGCCLGAIIGKNPGSAKAAVAGWGELRLDGDNLLPNIHSLFMKSFWRAGKQPPAEAYIQVLNLFYVCDKDLSSATATLAQQNDIYADPAESNSFPFVFFAWGGKSASLDPLKKQFLAAHGKSRAFFYSPKTGTVITRPPGITEMAKHPQGLPHEPMVSYLATVL